MNKITIPNQIIIYLGILDIVLVIIFIYILYPESTLEFLKLIMPGLGGTLGAIVAFKLAQTSLLKNELIKNELIDVRKKNNVYLGYLSELSIIKSEIDNFFDTIRVYIVRNRNEINNESQNIFERWRSEKEDLIIKNKELEKLILELDTYTIKKILRFIYRKKSFYTLNNFLILKNSYPDLILLNKIIVMDIINFNNKINAIGYDISNFSDRYFKITQSTEIELDIKVGKNMVVYICGFLNDNKDLLFEIGIITEEISTNVLG